MINNNTSSLELAPIEELAAKPRSYVYTRLDQPESAERHVPQEGLIGLIGVTMTGVNLRDNSGPQTSYRINDSLLFDDSGAVESMLDAHQRTYESLQDEPLNEALKNFTRDHYDKEGHQLFKTGHRLIGGLALHETASEGRTAGTFIAWNLRLQTKWDAGTEKISESDYMANRRADAQKQLLRRSLPYGEVEMSRMVNHMMKSVVIDALPTPMDLRQQLEFDGGSKRSADVVAINTDAKIYNREQAAQAVVALS